MGNGYMIKIFLTLHFLVLFCMVVHGGEQLSPLQLFQASFTMPKPEMPFPSRYAYSWGRADILYVYQDGLFIHMKLKRGAKSTSDGKSLKIHPVKYMAEEPLEESLLAAMVHKQAKTPFKNRDAGDVFLMYVTGLVLLKSRELSLTHPQKTALDYLNTIFPVIGQNLEAEALEIIKKDYEGKS
jgi:hypothetical protein